MVEGIIAEKTDEFHNVGRENMNLESMWQEKKGTMGVKIALNLIFVTMLKKLDKYVFYGTFGMIL